MIDHKARIVRWATPIILVVGFFGAGTASAQDPTDDPAQIEAGGAVYAASCAGCHGAEGEGADAGRPLTDIAAQEPDRSVHVASVTNGKGGMPAFADRLSADEIDSAISYVRLSFTAQTDDDEGAMEELPRTGFEDSLLILGAALIGLGATTTLFGHRARNNADRV